MKQEDPIEMINTNIRLHIRKNIEQFGAPRRRRIMAVFRLVLTVSPTLYNFTAHLQRCTNICHEEKVDTTIQSVYAFLLEIVF